MSRNVSNQVRAQSRLGKLRLEKTLKICSDCKPASAPSILHKLLICILFIVIYIIYHLSGNILVKTQ